MSSIPAGTTSVLLADNYGLDVEFSSKVVFVSTLLAIITVPTMMLFI